MKRNIAIVWGGYTSEIIVSEKSMKGIYSFIDLEKYNVYKLKLVRDSWTIDIDDQSCTVDKNDFSFVNPTNNKKVNLEFAYITIHGEPGENGYLQGYLEMLGIPYSNPGVMSSSLTMNKYICNKYLKNQGITIADSELLKQGDRYDSDQIIAQLGLPMFVKPNTGGSSFATTKVKSKEQLEPAIKDAFGETSEVIIESFVAGCEVTCGCYKANGAKTALPITEVVTTNEFFNYGAKYNGEVEEITPARISDEMTKKIQELTLKIYDLVDAKGMIRADFIISDNVPYLLEVNTTPGMTVTSFIPQQVAAAGLSMKEVLTNIIENEFN